MTQETMTGAEVAALLRGEHVPPRPAKRPLPKAKGRPVRQPGSMNKLEQSYAAELHEQERRGSIAWWAFEPVKLRLADATFYTPDFCVMQLDGTIDFVETKGHWEDDARVKIKVAAKLFPMFRFLALKPKPTKDGGGWHVEEF